MSNRVAVREIPKDQWATEAPNCPHETFMGQWVPQADERPRQVHSIVSIQMNGNPWLLQVIEWHTDMGYVHGACVFKTYDEAGNEVDWPTIMVDFPEAKEATETWFFDDFLAHNPGKVEL